MREIVVDDDVFAALQARAEPLVDDANSVLRKLLGLATNQSRSWEAQAIRPAEFAPPGRAPRRSTLPDAAYRLPILRALAEMDGRGSTSEVLERVGRLMEGQLGVLDRARLASGDVRWRNRAQFARMHMVETGDLAPDSPRGVWELTEQGRRRLVAETSQAGA